jgi:hypothetical protein
MRERLYVWTCGAVFAAVVAALLVWKLSIQVCNCEGKQHARPDCPTNVGEVSD